MPQMSYAIAATPLMSRYAIAAAAAASR